MRSNSSNDNRTFYNRQLMKLFSVFAFLLAMAAYTQSLDFITQSDGLEAWNSKANTSVAISPDWKKLLVSIKNTEYNFGWFRRAFPLCDYQKMEGVYGRYSTNDDTSCDFGAYVVLFREGKPIYYQQDICTIENTHGEWREFFLPFKGFKPSRGAAGMMFSTGMITEGDNLEFTLNGLLSNETKVEFDSIRLVPKSSEPELLKRVKRITVSSLLKSEENCTGAAHPRLLLHGDFLARIKDKANAGGVEQQGYEAFVARANECMRSFNTDDPLKRIKDFTVPSGLNAHRQQASFEGISTPTFRPIEILAAAGLITGDENYSIAAAKGLVNMAAALDVNSPEIDLGFFYTRTFYVRALAFAYDWTWKYMTPEERHEVKTALLGFVLDIYNSSWFASWAKHPLHRVWNWNPGLVSCAGLGMLALEGETSTEELAIIFEMRRHLKDYLTLGIDFDGCGHEGPGYINYGIGSGPEFAECLRQQGRGDLFVETNWHLIAPWIVAETLPDRSGFNNLSDCSLSQIAGGPFYSYTCGRYAGLAKNDPMRDGERMPKQQAMEHGMDYLAHFRESPGTRILSYEALARLMAWAWNSGATSKDIPSLAANSALAHVLFYKDVTEIENPGALLPESMLFRGRGLAVSRVGYDAQSLHLAIEAGPHATGHDQGDKGTFTLRAFGLDMFIDSGYGNDGDKFKSGSSFAHNVVLVDGEGQPISWHNNSNGEITGYKHSNEYDWIRVNAIDAWNLTFSQFRPRRTGRNLLRAERQFILVRPNGNTNIPPYIVVFDDMLKAGRHAYTWQWHAPCNMEFTIGQKSWLAKPFQLKADVLTSSLDYIKGKATFNFIAPSDGDFKLLGFTAANGKIPTKSDSFSLEVNGVKIPSWDLPGTSSLVWSEVKNRGEQLAYKMSLTKGEAVTVILKCREPEACLAKMALAPYAEKAPADPLGEIPGAHILSASQANQGEPPFLLRSIGDAILPEASITVFPAGTPDGKTKMEWYEPTHGGTHPKLLHTVESDNEPNFIMVLVPRQNNSQQLPIDVTTQNDGFPSVKIKWDGRTDLVSFPLSNAQSQNSHRTMLFKQTN